MSATKRRSPSRPIGLAIVGVVFALVAGACSGAGGGGGSAGSTTITMAAVDNPQMGDLKTILPNFETAHPNIKVNIVTLPEDHLRQQVNTDLAAKSGRVYLFTAGTYEVQVCANLGRSVNLAPYT